ncbi:MAG: MBL fold metallo-hydrolase [Hydrogenophaga sp.]|uniref:MBL fold metallo-hydrolase n=1 Tax=Hydrogenophaga sp. TaxID=1904254 RepID=UPI003D9B3CA8
MNALRAVCALVCGWLAGVASVQAAPRCADDVPWQRVAAGVWHWSPAVEAEIGYANAGHVLPTSVVLHGAQALLIDPGPSHAHGQRLRRSLACRFGAQVRWIVNTHAHAENVLGNSAFADQVADGTVQILATAATRAGMAQRCPDCLASLTAKAGTDAMAGTNIVLPTRTLTEGEVLRVGPYRLRVLRTEQGHTGGDLVLWDAQRRLLWAGGLVYGQRLPELAQGSLDGWLAALDRLATLRPRLVVGNVVSVASDASTLPPALTGTRAYLGALRSGVLNAMDQGLQASDATTVTLPAYSAWAGHAERQGFNAQRAWRELEPNWMEQESPAK